MVEEGSEWQGCYQRRPSVRLPIPRSASRYHQCPKGVSVTRAARAGDIRTAAVDPGEVIPTGVERDHVNVVFDLFGMAGCQSGKPLHVLAHGLIVLLNIGRRPAPRWAGQEPVLRDAAAFAGVGI